MSYEASFERAQFNILIILTRYRIMNHMCQNRITGSRLGPELKKHLFGKRIYFIVELGYSTRKYSTKIANNMLCA